MDKNDKLDNKVQTLTISFDDHNYKYMKYNTFDKIFDIISNCSQYNFLLNQ